jgi:hypothetical protein
LDFEVRCVRDRAWIQKNLISLLATTIPSSAQPLRQAKIRNSGHRQKRRLPYPQLIGQITRQEMRMVRD